MTEKKKVEIIDFKPQYQEFVNSLEGKTEQELLDIEQKIIKEADDEEKRVAALEFKLPKEGRKKVFEIIRKYLNKGAYQWNYCLGSKQLYEKWIEDTDKIQFPVLDSTLRILGEKVFTGYDEWCEVCTVNKYFESVRPEYVNATNQIYFISEKHNAVINKLDLFKPQTGGAEKETPKVDA